MEKFGEEHCKKYFPMGMFFAKHTDKICKDSDMKNDFLNLVRLSKMNLECPESTPDSKPTPEETQKKGLYDSCKNDNECLSNFCSKFTFKCKPKNCNNDQDCPKKQYCQKGFGHSPRCEDLKN